jgi:penicillin-binding protein 1A
LFSQTWHEIMAYAHQGVELKAIPGLGPQATGRQQVAEGKDGKKDGADAAPARLSTVLTKRGTDALVRIERLMDDATRALATSAGPSKVTDALGSGTPARPSPVASSDQRPASTIRGN